MEASLKTFPTDLPLVLQQCNDLTHLQEVLLARSLEQQQENSERLVDESRSSREECEELLKQLQVIHLATIILAVHPVPYSSPCQQLEPTYPSHTK